MKKSEVMIDNTYVAKISGRLCPVRLTGKSAFGGWVGINLRTRKGVHIKTAAKLRRQIDPQVVERFGWENIR